MVHTWPLGRQASGRALLALASVVTAAPRPTHAPSPAAGRSLVTCKIGASPAAGRALRRRGSSPVTCTLGARLLITGLPARGKPRPTRACIICAWCTCCGCCGCCALPVQCSPGRCVFAVLVALAAYGSRRLLCVCGCASGGCPCCRWSPCWRWASALASPPTPASRAPGPGLACPAWPPPARGGPDLPLGSCAGGRVGPCASPTSWAHLSCSRRSISASRAACDRSVPWLSSLSSLSPLCQGD